MEPCPTRTNPRKKKPPAAPPKEGGRKERRAQLPLRAATWRKMTQGPLTPLNRKEPLKELKEHMSASNDNTQPLTAETVNAIVSALGAVVFATVRRLPPQEQQAFAKDLAAMAKAAEKSGETALETILIDLHKAAVKAP